MARQVKQETFDAGEVEMSAASQRVVEKYEPEKTYRYWRAVTETTPEGKLITKREEVELPSNQFKITAPRFWVDNPEKPEYGRYINAKPDRPVIVTVREGEKLDRGLIPVSQETKPPKPHHGKATGPGKRSDEHFSERPSDREI